MIIIVGAGLSGLACATRLEESGVDWLMLEGSDKPGGRVSTEITSDGYHLDRGFQVLLDSYPTARKLLDFSSLCPRYFQSGALLFGSNYSERILNPLQHPAYILAAPFIRSISLREKISLGIHGAIQCLKSDEALLHREIGKTALEELQEMGLGEDILEKFLRPFFAGVFLDNELGTDASVLRYDLKKFAFGRALLPSGGMGMIPRQLAEKLPASRQRYGTVVSALKRTGSAITGVELASGEEISAEHVILATDEGSSCRLLGIPEQRRWSVVSTYYFTGSQRLYEGKLLVLPEGRGSIVRHFTDLTNTAPEYAPQGKRLLSATVLNPPESDQSSRVHDEIRRYFYGFSDWKFLREVRVLRALPSQAPGFRALFPEKHPASNLWLAGDQVAHASIESALASGLGVADEVLDCIG
jgi:protoporphyrinogen oxidase